jgi:hypothetical protein
MVILTWAAATAAPVLRESISVFPYETDLTQPRASLQARELLDMN